MPLSLDLIACLKIRRKLVELIHLSGASHLGTCLSLVEILYAVFKSVDLNLIKIKSRERDRIILSKGHGAAALYSTMNFFELIPDSVLETFHKPGSLLHGHVSHNVNTVEHSTGGLGHGPAVGVGHAISMLNAKSDGHVYVICGDGEIQEG